MCRLMREAGTDEMTNTLYEKITDKRIKQENIRKLNVVENLGVNLHTSLNISKECTKERKKRGKFTM